MRDKLIFKEDTHEYFLNGIKIPSVTFVLQAEGIIDFSMVPPERLEAARQFGTAAHKAWELWDRKDLDMKTLSAPLVPVLQGWIKFCKDNKVKIVANELRGYSRTWMYGMTLDRVITLKNKLTLVDLKTSAEHHPGNRLQTAAYKIGWEERNPKRKIKQRMSLLIHADGSTDPEYYDDPREEREWLSVLTTHYFKHRNNLLKGEFKW